MTTLNKINKQITEVSKPLMSMDSTAVKEDDLPAIPQPILHNAPEDLESAIERIMMLEMKLDDLSRACEIAVITQQLELVDAFKRAADEVLKDKITIEQPSQEDFKITIITDKEDAEVK